MMEKTMRNIYLAIFLLIVPISNVFSKTGNEALPLEVALIGPQGAIKSLDSNKDMKGKKFAVLAGESFQKEYVAKKKGL